MDCPRCGERLGYSFMFREEGKCLYCGLPLFPVASEGPLDQSGRKEMEQGQEPHSVNRMWRLFKRGGVGLRRKRDGR